MTLSKSKRQILHEATARVANTIADQLATMLRETGYGVKTETDQSKSTGSVYLKIRVYTADGQRLKSLGAAIRVADHKAKPADRWTNFSRPARRFYGIWIYSPPCKIVRKVERIGQHIIHGIHLAGTRRNGGDA